jgi:hypothetical protein
LWDVASWKEAEVGPGKDGDFVKERCVDLIFFYVLPYKLTFHRVHCRVYKSTNL